MRACLPALAMVMLLSGGCSEDACRTGSGEAIRAGSKSKNMVIRQLTTELHVFDGQGERLKLEASVEDLVRSELHKAKSLRMLEEGEESTSKARMRVKVLLSPDGSTGELHAIVSGRIDRSGSIPLTADLDAVRAGATDGGTLSQEIYNAHLKVAVGDMVTALDDQARLLVAGNDGLIKALGHPERDIRMAAARALGERRATEGVGPLCKLLDEDRAEVGEAAVGALVAIGEQKAVPCLIRWAGPDDRRLVLVIEPLSSLGGDEARAFLEMIASGHEVPGIRDVAEHGLRSMRKASPQDAAAAQR